MCTHLNKDIYLYAWKLKCSCSWMLEHSHALMIVHKSSGDGTISCMCTWMFKCSCALMFNALLITWSHRYLLWQSFAHMSTYLDDHMLLFSHVLIFTYFYVLTLWWSYTSMFTCFDDRMLLCLHTLTRRCPLARIP